MVGKYDLNTTTVGTLLDDPDAEAIIARLAPELPGHPMIAMARSLPFNTMIGMSAGQMNAAVVAELKTELEAL